MSYRYPAGFLKPGLNTAATSAPPGTTRCGGVWRLNAASAAKGAGLWTGGPFLFAWGNDQFGQLGLSTTQYYSSPKQVGSTTTWSQVCSTNSGSGGVRSDGTLWMWGRNEIGQLGLGNRTYYLSPKQVGNLTNWSQVNTTATSNQAFTVAVKTDGTLWSWGYNGTGQLGLGNITNYSSPKQVGSLTNWSKISCGVNFTIATKTDGTMWSWGNNYWGQLGLNNVNYQSSPNQIGALTTWLNISAGAYEAFAIKTDGTLWSWGNNSQGQLGLESFGAYTQKSSPTQVGALTNWLSVSSGYISTVAIKTDGTMWVWGGNANGQLGLGNRTNYSSPKQLGALTTWTAASGRPGSASTFGIKAGTLWSWGNNQSGQLGLGVATTIKYSSPKQVGSLTSWSQISTGYGTSILGIAVQN